MDVYLVGGAVRNHLMGQSITDRDWVVVGATPEEMLAAGYKQVGKDFPVFLHPKTKEEYALARTERQTGPGHTGFVCQFGQEVTLAEDLRRRDLTINAIAQDGQGQYQDPYQGRVDIEKKLLRHISLAFKEDPLRVFRVARFQATFPEFTIAPETQVLLREMVASDACAHLSQERIVAELKKVLQTKAPWLFFGVLTELGYQDSAVSHFNTSVAKQSMQGLANLTEEKVLCALLWKQSAQVIAGLKEWGLPAVWKRLCQTHKFWLICETNQPLTVEKWLKLLTGLDAFRRSNVIELVLAMRDHSYSTTDLHTWQLIKSAYSQIDWAFLLQSCADAEKPGRVNQEKWRIITQVLGEQSY